MAILLNRMNVIINLVRNGVTGQDMGGVLNHVVVALLSVAADVKMAKRAWTVKVSVTRKGNAIRKNVQHGLSGTIGINVRFLAEVAQSHEKENAKEKVNSILLTIKNLKSLKNK